MSNHTNDTMSSDTKAPRANGHRSVRRVRTDAQMAQKRLGDRQKQKTKRAESKMRMERIEKDVAYLRQRLEVVTSPPTILQQGSNQDAGGREASWPAQSVPNNLSILTNDTPTFQRTCGPHELPSYDTTSAWAIDRLRIDCRCGIEHPDQSSCLEYAISALLFRVHLSRTQGIVPSLPRDPTLANILGLSDRDNIIVSALRTFAALPDLINTETYFGLYFLAYRLLRCRLFPESSASDDVPAWFRATNVQECTPHPVVIDFIPWPRLRDYFCLNQNKDTRHSVLLFVSSIRLIWPAGEQVVSRTSNGEFAYGEKLKTVASDLRCWRMSSPWVDVFPDLTKYLVAQG